jgi:hypothetical protein
VNNNTTITQTKGTAMELLWGDDVSGKRKVGEVGFLVHRANNILDWERWNLFDRPAHTTKGGVPIFIGKCGTTHGVTITAYGMAKIAKRARNGRVCYEQLTDLDEISQALEELGYPDLLFYAEEAREKREF